MSNIKLTDALVKVRHATEGDVGFIFNSWLKSYRSSSFSKFIPGPVYFDHHHKVIEAILKRATVLVACNPKDNNQIYGYLVFEQQLDVFVGHYTYVKDAYRKMGVLGLLLNAAKLPNNYFYSHSTMLAGQVLSKLKSQGVYSPYLAFPNVQLVEEK